jgi:hypothetical protein
MAPFRDWQEMHRYVVGPHQFTFHYVGYSSNDFDDGYWNLFELPDCNRSRSGVYGNSIKLGRSLGDGLR